MSVGVYGDSLSIGWPDLMEPMVLFASSVGGSKLLSDPAHPQLGWSPTAKRPNLWDTVVMQEPIPDIAIVSLGRNDLHLGVSPGGPTGIPPYAFRSHMMSFRNGLLGLGVQTVHWLQLDRGPSNQTRAACAAVYRDAIYGVNGEDFTVPLDRMLSDQHIGGDGVHHSQSGYEFIATILSSWVKP